MKKQINLILGLTIIGLSCLVTINAQIAAGGTYSLDQTLIASGGGESSNGGNFKVEGSIGQANAGTNSTNNPFAVQVGFWTGEALTPTAAPVSVNGRILAPDGYGLRNARVILTDFQGNPRTVTSGAFGYFKFEEVEVGQNYVISIDSKRFQFAPQVLAVFEEITNLEIVAQSMLR